MMAMPKFEHHKIPNVSSVVATALFIMPLEQALQRGPLEISALNSAGFQQERSGQITKTPVMPQPLTGRHAKAMFLFSQYLYRQEFLECFFKHIALSQPLDF